MLQQRKGEVDSGQPQVRCMAVRAGRDARQRGGRLHGNATSSQGARHGHRAAQHACGRWTSRRGPRSARSNTPSGDRQRLARIRHQDVVPCAPHP
eukprot:1109886-Heterocapsa_arctica.AAC.1